MVLTKMKYIFIIFFLAFTFYILNACTYDKSLKAATNHKVVTKDIVPINNIPMNHLDIQPENFLEQKISATNFSIASFTITNMFSDSISFKYSTIDKVELVNNENINACNAKGVFRVLIPLEKCFIDLIIEPDNNISGKQIVIDYKVSNDNRTYQAVYNINDFLTF